MHTSEEIIDHIEDLLKQSRHETDYVYIYGDDELPGVGMAIGDDNDLPTVTDPKALEAYTIRSGGSDYLYFTLDIMSVANGTYDTLLLLWAEDDED